MEGITASGHPPKEGGWTAAIQRLDNAFGLITAAKDTTTDPDERATLTGVTQQGLVMLGFAKDAQAGRAALNSHEHDETLTSIAEFCQAVEDELGSIKSQGAHA